MTQKANGFSRLTAPSQQRQVPANVNGLNSSLIFCARSGE